jgi:hypothetical protein
MGRLIKKHSFGKYNTAKRIAGRVAAAALGTFSNAVLDGWHGSVEFANGKELTIKSLPADHPFFAVAVDKKRGKQDKIVTVTIILTLIAVSANYCFLKTLSKRSERNNCNFQK